MLGKIISEILGSDEANFIQGKLKEAASTGVAVS